MSDAEKDEALLKHVCGATVTHHSPFSAVEVPSQKHLLSQAEINKWVGPFYLNNFLQVPPNFSDQLRTIYHEIDADLIVKLLTDFNWRPRLTGAIFATLKRITCVEDQIGRLLVRSDLCYAGTFYCVALAEFNSPTGLAYLQNYLAYYLTRPDLVFNQSDAIGALVYLDKINCTRHFETVRPHWDAYTSRKAWPNLGKCVDNFTAHMDTMHKIRAEVEHSE